MPRPEARLYMYCRAGGDALHAFRRPWTPVETVFLFFSGDTLFAAPLHARLDGCPILQREFSLEGGMLGVIRVMGLCSPFVSLSV